MPLVDRWGPPSFPRGLDLEVVQFTGNLTVTDDHRDAIMQCADGSDVTVTLPRNAPVGRFVFFEQGGAGAVIFAAASGATLVNRLSYDRTAGQYALVSVFVRSNTNGMNAVWALNGDAA